MLPENTNINLLTKTTTGIALEQAEKMIDAAKQKAQEIDTKTITPWPKPERPPLMLSKSGYFTLADTSVGGTPQRAQRIGLLTKRKER